MGLVLLAVPVAEEVSKDFPYITTGESHVDRAAGRAALTLNSNYFVPLSQNTCWSLSMLLSWALCNPSLHLFLQMSIYSIPSYPLCRMMHKPLHFFPRLKFPPLLPSIKVLLVLSPPPAQNSTTFLARGT